jgi:hypothetical protein
MTLLATLRQQQRIRARTVLGLLVVVWLNLALQACAATTQANDMPADRTVASHTLDPFGAHSGHAHGEQCPFCPGCEHDGRAEHGSCDSPVVAGTKADISSLVTPVQPPFGVTTAAVSLTKQYCVYLI